jgi:hypothetical protein
MSAIGKADVQISKLKTSQETFKRGKESVTIEKDCHMSPIPVIYPTIPRRHKELAGFFSL